MFNLAIFVLCTSIVFVNSQHDHDHHDHQVSVDVYYESMCSDSIAFVTKQLYPALQMPEISKHINLTLIPFGKTKVLENTTTHDQYFECHHGPAECAGNKIHACALNLLPRDPDGRVSKVTVDLVNCLLGTVKLNGVQTQFPLKECSETQQVSKYLEIDTCSNSHEGKQYLIQEGQKTDLVRKPLKSAPTIVFDGTYKQEESSEAEKNFIKTLCKYIKHDQPAECKNGGAETRTVSLGISLMLLAITYLLH